MACGDRRCDITMFALFEAGSQVIFIVSPPRFGFASRGANHVSPLRGDKSCQVVADQRASIISVESMHQRTLKKQSKTSIAINFPFIRSTKDTKVAEE